MVEQIISQIPQFFHCQDTFMRKCIVLMKDDFFLITNFDIQLVKKVRE
jgi:hypothetical protein